MIETEDFAQTSRRPCNRRRILCRDVFRSFAGPSDFVSNKGADRLRRGRPKNDSVPERRIGIMDGNIASSATKRPRGYLHFALLRQRRSRGALGGRGG